MKKIFTLLFCTAIISSAFAGDDHRGSRERGSGVENHNHQEFRQPDHRNWNEGFQSHAVGFLRPLVEAFRPALRVNFIEYGNMQYRLDQRDVLIAQITSDYDYQIQQVANDYNLNPDEKDYQIDNLQGQKQQAIDNVYAQCGVAVPMGLQISLGRRYR